MVKTTINLEGQLYKKLVKEALERYGKTRSFSKLINEKLKEAEKISSKSKSSNVKMRKSVVEMAFGIWGKGESGREYVRKIRNEEEKRLQKMGL